MFTDPITITLNGVVHTLNKIDSMGRRSVYTTGDQNLRCEISHQPLKNGRVRSLVKIVQRKSVLDPISQKTDYDTTGVNITLDRPEYGWTPTELNYLVQGGFAFLSAAHVTKLIEQQH